MQSHNKIPVTYFFFIHNLTNYDSHLFVEELGKLPGDIKVIPEKTEKYISVSQFVKVDEYTSKKQVN